MCNGERDLFHEVLLRGETLVFSPLRPLRAIAEVEGGSTFHETCLATEVPKTFMKLTMLCSATPAETCFATRLHTSFSQKFQRVTMALAVGRLYRVLRILRSGQGRKENRKNILSTTWQTKYFFWYFNHFIISTQYIM